jgi:RHS repeat-associated protein
VTKVRCGDGTEIEYTYDVLGRRISKQVGGVRTEFLWTGPELAAEVHDGNITDAVFGCDWEPLAFWHGAERSTPITDGARAPRIVLGERGALQWRCTLDAYGNVLAQAGPSATPLRFRGQYHDEETGFHYNFARSYDPLLCNYLSPDPLGIEGGIHLYAYARNPLLWDDPLGLTCFAHEAEDKMDKHMRRRGYFKLSAGSGHSLNTNGIDGVYKFRGRMGHTPPPPPPMYIIGEAKSGNASLGKTLGSGKQMSDMWIDSPVRTGGGPTRLEDAVGRRWANKINRQATRTAAGATTPNVQKEVFKVKIRGTPGRVTKTGAYTQSGSSTW